MYISIQNKIKIRDFGRTEFAEICQENFLLIHAKINTRVETLPVIHDEVTMFLS